MTPTNPTAELRPILGIDLAVRAERTGAVLMTWSSDEEWEADELDGPLNNERLLDAARKADLVGVDSPLGWPTAVVGTATAV